MSFLSGLRPNETGININDVPIRDYLPEVVTLPQHFKNHGYQAVALGKVYHQGSGDAASWDYYWDGPPQRTYNLEKNRIINEVGNKKKRGRPYEDTDVPDGYYTDGMITDSAITWLDRFETDRPFFLAVGLMKPHLPFNAPRKYWDQYNEPGLRYKRVDNRPEGSPDYAFANSGELGCPGRQASGQTGRNGRG
jgi:iduronate 2-sulfatase